MAKNVSVHHNISKLNNDTWRDVVLNSQINLGYVDQTYDILFMVERTENASNALAKFYYGAKEDHLNVVKPVAYEDILQNIKEFSATPLSDNRTVEHLYNLAAKECINYLNNSKNLPCGWMAALIKLHVMFLLDKDVTKVYENIVYARDLQSTQITLLEGDKKIKVKMDPCDPRNVYNFKSTSMLKSTLRKQLMGPETIQVPPKHMFFVIIGFYDYELLKELFSLKVPVTGFIELVEPNLKHICGQFCNRADCYDVEDGLSIKEEVLVSFWHRFNKCFEAEDYMECFDNTFHMTIQLRDDAFKNEHTDNKLCFDVFTSIGTEIVKTLDVQRLHANYIRNVKIWEITSQPKFIPVKSYSLYNDIMNTLPPECFSVAMIVDALLDQLNILPPNTSGGKSTIFHKRNVPLEVPKYHFGIKTCIVDVLGQNIKSQCFYKTTAKEDGSKIYLPITRNQFLVDANNDNYIKASPYDSIRAEYLQRNQHILEKCNSALLWKIYKLPEDMKVLAAKYHLKKLADDLDIPIQELQYIVHVILFLSIKCCRNIPLLRKTWFETVFPQLKDATPDLPNFKANIKNETEYILKDSLNELFTSLPNLTYSDEPNVYESKNMENYKWYEKLSTDVMVQELYKTERFYLCLDYKYCAFDDTILLRFHNNLDDFGINKKNWHQSLRTYVGVKEFCKYIIHEDTQWLEHQERKYTQSCENEYRNHIIFNEHLKQKVYPKLVFSDVDFIQPGSFKAKMAATRSGIEMMSKSFIKSRSKIGIGGLEKISLPTELPVRKKLSVHCAKSPPYNFFAYDLSKKRIQLTGSTIVFCSQDGVKVTVDQTKFLRHPNNMSINVTADGHSLILHKNDRTWLEPFTFHFSLSDNTIIAFAKPYKPITPEEKVSDNIYRTLKDGDLNKRQNLFFISDSQNYVLKCFNIPFITKKQLILSEELLPSFLHRIKERGIPLKLIPSRQTLSMEEIRDLESITRNSVSRKSIRRSVEESNLKLSKCSSGETKEKLRDRYELKPTKKVVCQTIFKAQCSKSNDDGELTQKVETEEENHDEVELLHKSRISFYNEDVQILKKSNPKLIKEIQKAIESQLPIFKICSSKLHRSQYVKRVKSYVEIPVGPILKRVLVKPRLQQTKREVHVSKLLPIKPLIIRNYPKYEMKVSFPSGLKVESVAGFDNDPFCIRQTYTDRGPQCKNIAHEVSRTYMRNGTLVIKKIDGNYDILYINGQIVNCNLPNYQEKLSREENAESVRNVKKGYSLSNLTYLHAYGSSSIKFKRYLHRVVHRLDKHVIGKAKTKTFTSYRCKSEKLKVSPNIIYLLQTSVAPFTKFSLITSDGKKLKVTKTAVMKENKFNSSATSEYRYEEFLLNREDGTHMLFNRESELFIQFPDGTRISSWIHIEDTLVNVLEEEPRCYNNKCNAAEQASLSEDETFPEVPSKSINSKETNNGWLSITLSFKFEHPNYGTVTFDGATQNAEIILPGNLKIDIAKEGEYHLDISKRIRATVTTSKLILESQLCNTCLQKCVAVLNVNPLYDKIKTMDNSTEIELLQVTDSFNKKFIVNFDGQCYSNTDYIRGRYNSVRCPVHNLIEYQKLFLLKRGLNGCKFWDVATYRNKIKCAIDEGRTIVKFHDNKKFQTFFSTTFKTEVYDPVDEKYLLPYDQPHLVLTKFKTGATEALKHLYTERQIFKNLPELAKVVCIYKALLKFSKEKNVVQIVSNKELNSFILNIFRQSEEEDKKNKVQQEKLEIQLAVAAEMVPPVPLLERWRKWRQEVNTYLSKIRKKYVPLYGASKLRKTLINDSVVHESVTSSSVPRGYIEADIDDSGLSFSSDSDSVSSVFDEVEEHLNENTEKTTGDNARGKLSVISEDNTDLPTTVISVTEVPKNVEKCYAIRKTKKQELFESPLAVDILHELILRLAFFITNLVIDENDLFSDGKVLCYVVEKIYTNIITAAKQLNTVLKEDLIDVASKILVNNICLENLNPREMHSLLEHLTKVENDDDVCKVLFDTTLTDCLEKCKLTKETKIKKQSNTNWYGTDSAYKLYSTYGFKEEVIESDDITTPPRNRSLTIVYEGPEEKEGSTERLLPEKNRFLLRSSYTNLLQQKSLGNFCQNCIDKSDFFKESKVSKDRLDSSSLSVLNIESDFNRSFSTSNALLPHISPDSVLRGFVNEDVTAIDSRTHLLEKSNFVPPESMRVLFSIGSLKGKDVKNLGPYVKRHPRLIEKNLAQMAEGTFEKEKDKSLDIISSPDACNRCVPKYFISTETYKVGAVNSLSVQKALKSSKSGNLISSKKSEEEKSNINIADITTTNVSYERRNYKSHVIAKVGDGDLQYLINDCPPTLDPAIHIKEKVADTSRKVIRKSVGIITQSGTLDNVTQT